MLDAIVASVLCSSSRIWMTERKIKMNREREYEPSQLQISKFYFIWNHFHLIIVNFSSTNFQVVFELSRKTYFDYFLFHLISHWLSSCSQPLAKAIRVIRLREKKGKKRKQQQSKNIHAENVWDYIKTVYLFVVHFISFFRFLLFFFSVRLSLSEHSR